MSDASTERLLARYLLEPRTRSRTAALSPPAAEQNGPFDSGSVKRSIPKGHEFQARALKPLSKALWASTVALGHALTAYRHLSRLKSVTVSPDGLIGGHGYVMKLSEMRQKLYEASEALSSISDTIHDELNAPHWKPKLAQLEESDKEDVTRFIDEAEQVMEDPEGEAEEEIEEIEDSKPKPKPKAKPKREKKGTPAVEDDSSSLPGGDNLQGDSVARQVPTPQTKEAALRRPPGMSERAWVHAFYGDPTREGYVAPVAPNAAEVAQSIYVKTGNSSLPVSELGGPRVDHLGPGTGGGEYGEFSEDEGPSLPAGLPTPSRAVGERHAARVALYSKLPQDVAGDVARSDYYVGSKDNLASIGTSEIPSPDEGTSESKGGLLNTNYTVENPATEYARYDNATHRLRKPGGLAPGEDHQEQFAPDDEATR